jgi:hypothetical protein
MDSQIDKGRWTDRLMAIWTIGDVERGSNQQIIKQTDGQTEKGFQFLIDGSHTNKAVTLTRRETLNVLLGISVFETT